MSGGQTGVDRAALDVALALDVPCGGWCPKGRLAEDGRIPPRYPLSETTTEDDPERTLLNVRDSDGTLILTRGAPVGGTALTRAFAEALGKPVFVADLASETATPPRVHEWIQREAIAILNVAGPRESAAPGIYKDAAAFLRALLRPRA